MSKLRLRTSALTFAFADSSMLSDTDFLRGMKMKDKKFSVKPKSKFVPPPVLGNLALTEKIGLGMELAANLL